ncbi:hypothetical protein IIB79_08375, partial [candidate division KSB1 bacterium]|nr:hypothetical protein [candidate division KSB1 bacterium]
GNFIVVVIAALGTGTDNIVTGITDTEGNTYVKAIEKTNATANRIQMWYTEDITGNANNITTATFTGSVQFRYISVAEFSGVATSSSLLDTSFLDNSSTTTHTSNNATSTSTGDLIIGASRSNAVDVTIGTGFTTLSIYNNRELISDNNELWSNIKEC